MKPCFLKILGSRRARLEISLLLGLCLAAAVSLWFANFARVAGAVRLDTLRLHVRACSNTPQDQLCKLRVRDAVVAAAGEIFGAAPDKSAALALARAALPRLQLTAEQAFWAAGGAPDTPVRVCLTQGWFAAARYGGTALPPGRYDALRVDLGRHTGRNWFCVLYPALCLPAAEGASYPTEEEQALVEGGYELRFAALEWLDKLAGRDREPDGAAADSAGTQSAALTQGAADSAPKEHTAQQSEGAASAAPCKNGQPGPGTADGARALSPPSRP